MAGHRSGRRRLRPRGGPGPDARRPGRRHRARPRCARSRRPSKKEPSPSCAASSGPSRDHRDPPGGADLLHRHQGGRGPTGPSPSPSAPPAASGCSASWRGASLSGLTGFIGMSLAVRGNVRTAAAARDGKLPGSAARWPSAPGPSRECCASASDCSGPRSSSSSSRTPPPPCWSGFGFGASLIALFMRVGRRASSPRPPTWVPTSWARSRRASPRTTPATRRPSPTTWATTWATAPAWRRTSSSPTSSPSWPPSSWATRPSRRSGGSFAGPLRPGPWCSRSIVPAIGIVASAIGVYVVRARPKDKSAMAPINRGFWTAAALTVLGAGLVAGFYLHYMKAFYAVLTGVVLVLVASQITEHFTSTERRPVREIAESARTGPGHDRRWRASPSASSPRCGPSSPSPSPSGCRWGWPTATSSSPST